MLGLIQADVQASGKGKYDPACEEKRGSLSGARGSPTWPSVGWSLGGHLGENDPWSSVGRR